MTDTKEPDFLKVSEYDSVFDLLGFDDADKREAVASALIRMSRRLINKGVIVKGKEKESFEIGKELYMDIFTGQPND